MLGQWCKFILRAQLLTKLLMIYKKKPIPRMHSFCFVCFRRCVNLVVLFPYLPPRSSNGYSHRRDVKQWGPCNKVDPDMTKE